jgi:hypothetical protein
MYTAPDNLWNALAFFGLSVEAFGGDGNFVGNKYFWCCKIIASRSF